MFGCLGRIGCGLLLILLGALGWAFRDAWVPRVRQFFAARADAIAIAHPIAAPAHLTGVRVAQGPVTLSGAQR